jgi:hypothetical protein
MSGNENLRFGIADVTANQYEDFNEDVSSIIKMRFYKARNQPFIKFTMKTNKL